ncbi:ubiquitin-conjugating enzyme E2Q-like protein 1 [Montipora foliosa]|uniref:ubiquitin-conjugating enzyme E2Q-like protein 1 n=1 Tax=Montipora foliosa TaxID=591990 RepID=UPI0035F19339
MASVLRKLVKRESRSGNGTDKNGCKAKGDGDRKKDKKDDDFSNQIQNGDETRQLNTSHPANSQGSNGLKNSEVCEMSSSHAQRVRSKRLLKEFHDVTVRCDSKLFSAELVEDNLFEWNVKLYKIDTDSLLYRDMLETGTKFILLNITFPDNFPFAPPFMRVTAPRIEGGFVLDGGAICMELLTPKGWSSAYTVEAIVLQFSAAVVKGQGRIDKSKKKAFSKKEAESAYKRLVKTHEKYGWVTPPKSEG